MAGLQKIHGFLTVSADFYIDGYRHTIEDAPDEIGIVNIIFDEQDKRILIWGVCYFNVRHRGQAITKVSIIDYSIRIGN